MLQKIITWVLLLYVCAAYAEEDDMKFPVLEGYMQGVNFGNWLCQCDGTQKHYDEHITEADFQRVAAWGFDHVRVPFSYEVIEKYGFEYLDRAVMWAQNAGLNIVLDMHKEPHYDFDNPDSSQSLMFLYEELQVEFAAYWKMIAEHFKDEGQYVAFEILNEVTDERPVVWNRIVKKCVEAIREVSPERNIIIGGVMWNSIDSMAKLPEFKDEHVIYTFHFYEPFALTHQGASWVEASASFQQAVTYPAGLEAYLDYAAHSGRSAALFEGLQRVDHQFLEKYIQPAVDFAAKRQVKVYVGEWGCIRNADAMSRRAYMQDVCALLKRYGIGNAVWNYRDNRDGGFSLVDPATGAVLDDALISILIAKTEEDVRAVDIENPVKVKDDYVKPAAAEPDAAYTIQTESYWGNDGGWMVLMSGDDGYSWMDNEENALRYNAAIRRDTEKGWSVTLNTQRDWVNGIMYTMFNVEDLGVRKEKLQLCLDLYVSDALALQESKAEIEMISGSRSWIGGQSLRWTIDWSSVHDGWNTLNLHYDDAMKLGNDAFDPERMKFLWFAAKSTPDGVEIKLANIRIQEQEDVDNEREKCIEVEEKLTLAYVENKSLDKLDDVTMTKLTHVNLAFGVIRNGRLSLQDLPGIGKLVALRKKYPDVKWVLSIGGWTADGFSQAAWDESTRNTFVESVIQVVQQYDLDGVDIDWEFPCNDVGGIAAHPNDRENYTLLLAALRTALGEKRLLSVAVSAEAWFITNTEMEKVAQIVDYVQIMTYDMRPGQMTTGHHTALYAPAESMEDNSVAQAVARYLEAGVPRHKIVIGAAFYGRHWKGGAAEEGIHLKTDTYAEYGPAYHDIIKLAEQEGYQLCWDDAACAPYLLGPELFISYDDPRSVALKCEYIQAQNLLGIMYWVHGFDDTGELLQTMATGLKTNGAE